MVNSVVSQYDPLYADNGKVRFRAHVTNPPSFSPGVVMPSYLAQVSRTKISIFVSNPDRRRYTALINFSWVHDDFAGNKIEKTVSTSAAVEGLADNALIFEMSGVNVRLTDDVAVIFK